MLDHSFDLVPHLLRWVNKHGSELALSEVEGVNLEQAPRVDAGKVERFTPFPGFDRGWSGLFRGSQKPSFCFLLLPAVP